MNSGFRVDLNGKVAVVTGGGGVLCSRLALALASSGAKVAILDLKLEAAERTASAIRDKGHTAIGVGANVLEKASLELAAQKVLEKLGPCDLLLNGAGGNHPAGTTGEEYLEVASLEKSGITTFFDLSFEGINFVFNLNFLGTLLPTQVFAKQMIGRTGCTVINISSMNAFRPLTKIPAYSAAKSAVSNFTQWLAVHFSKVGIRVNALAPGFFLTDQNRALLVNAETGEFTPRAGKILAHTPLGRFGEPSDLDGTLLWLACEQASGFVTGVVVPIDGGFASYSGV